ncbi:MAG: methylaspartate mutase [candidate division WS1 bacterium]|nr:methylaspartate mutase [candidate division WS1 bacterium]
MPPQEQLRSILATDCGSTTTKAILIELVDGEYRLRVRGEAPTTVEAPFEDVTVGVGNAVREVEELSGRTLMRDGEIIRPQSGDIGVDAYVSTSSAGGGLQVMVVGLVRSMTAESAQRAALGAGAIVMDVVALDDGRRDYERIERMRELRPDMILISGGTDGGEIRRVVEMAELVAAANPQARLGADYQLPVIFAGNTGARELVTGALERATQLTVVPNLRPTMEREELGPARDEIQELFLQHVMAQAPGYSKLMDWTDADIMPTPAAVGTLIEAVAARESINVVGVDIGGATTDVFSVFGGTFNRTVSANLGMSYSISNVLAEAGLDNILRWLTMHPDPRRLGNDIRNKMIRPTTIPQNLLGLMVEQGVAREALRLAFEQHKMLASGLKGVQRQRDISDAFGAGGAESLVDMMALDLIVGSGGVLSHAPRRRQAALMMIDAFEPQGITRLAVDSIFMMPQLGVLSTISDQAATEVFYRDCLIPLGPCIAPVGNARPGVPCLRITLSRASGSEIVDVPAGEMRLLPLAEDERVQVTVEPTRAFDVGDGRGRAMETQVAGGVVGMIVDTRGRPLRLPEDDAERIATLEQWYRALGAYPEVPVERVGEVG